MKETRMVMGMPATIEVVDDFVTQENLNEVFDYFTYVDEKFSVYKTTSEISKYNRGEITLDDLSDNMKLIFKLSEETKNVTNGYFDINFKETCDPSGLVKGWAIYNGAKILRKYNLKNFCVEIAGDMEVSGLNQDGENWKIGIRNPFKVGEIIKVVQLQNKGIATSGTSIRGEHIINPLNHMPANAIVSLTVIGPNVYEADRFATAAFAMGQTGIQFIEDLPGFDGYMVDHQGIATFTSNFNQYTI